MEILLTPGDLQNDNYRLNIPIRYRNAIVNAFSNQPVILVLGYELIVEIPNDNLTFANWHAFADARLNQWLHDTHAVPYERGNPPELSFVLVETSIGNFLVSRQ